MAPSTPTNGLFSELSLTAYTSTKQWLVLGFVPMAWTFVCPTEILAFSERASDFAARGASVVFASTDSEYSLLAWTNASKKDGGLGKINIPLLSDKNHSISKDYGVLRITCTSEPLDNTSFLPSGIYQEQLLDFGFL